jgi:hypothetical protein
LPSTAGAPSSISVAIAERHRCILRRHGWRLLRQVLLEQLAAVVDEEVASNPATSDLLLRLRHCQQSISPAMKKQKKAARAELRHQAWCASLDGACRHCQQTWQEDHSMILWTFTDGFCIIKGTCCIMDD